MPRCAGASLLATGLLLAACSPSGSAKPPSSGGRSASGEGSASTTTSPDIPTGGTLAWHRCDARFRCANLRVPISYSQPGGGTIHIAVVELPATGNPSTARDLVLNPGGPGASGISFLEQASSAFPAALRQVFNLVSFDPRGVGQSEPVVCETPAGLRRWINFNPAPSTPRQISRVEAETRSFVANCVKSQPADVLANLSTAVTAHDLDRLRAALGEPKLDYLGFSYGTYLGALYAAAFPAKVGALVLDGAVDPSLSTRSLDLQQGEAFEGDLHDFFKWCATDSTCSSELPDAPVDYGELISEVKARAIPANLSPALGGTEMIGYPVVLEGVVSTLYSTNTWKYLAQAIAAGLAGDGTVITELAYSFAGFNANGTVANEISAQVAISCLDRPAPPLPEYPKLAAAFAKKAPDFGPAEAWGTLPCNYWPDPPTGGPTTIHLARPLHILVVGSTHDPATPYAWAQALTHQLDGAVLLTRTGDGHTGYFSSACVRRWVDGFLSGSGAPPPGTICASN